MKLTKIELETTRKHRLESHKIRKSILLSVSIIILTTSALIYLIIFVSPEKYWAIPTFFVLFLIEFFYVFSILFVKRRRGLLAALILSSLLILKYFGVTKYLFYLIPVFLGIVIELFLSFKRR